MKTNIIGASVCLVLATVILFNINSISSSIAKLPQLAAVGSGVPGLPTNLTGSCPTGGGTINTTWTMSNPTDSIQYRVNDISNGWNGACNTSYAPGNPNVGDICRDIPANYVPSQVFMGIAGHTYNWWVAECNANGCSDSKVGPQITCSSVATAPTTLPVPSTLAASCLAGSDPSKPVLTLNWNSLPSPYYYAIRVGTSEALPNTASCANGTTRCNDTVVENSNKPFVTTGTPGTTYTWWVHSRYPVSGTPAGSDPWSSAASAAQVTCPKSDVPPTPTSLVGSCDASGNIKFSWQPTISSPLSYSLRVYSNDALGGLTHLVNNVYGTDVSTNSFTATGGVAGHSYAFYVYAKNGTVVGENSVQSAMINCSGSVPVPTNIVVSPVTPTVDNPLGLNIGLINSPTTYEQQLVWQDVSGVTGYAVYMNGLLLGTTKNPYFKIPGNALMPEQVYKFTVVVSNDLSNVPQTVSYLPKTWWQSALASVAQTLGLSGPMQSSVSLTAPSAPKVTNGKLNILAVLVNMKGQDGTINGPGHLSVTETEDALKTKLFGSVGSVADIYAKQSTISGQQKLSVSGNVMTIEVPYASDFPVTQYSVGLMYHLSDYFFRAMALAVMSIPNTSMPYNTYLFVWPNLGTPLGVGSGNDPDTVIYGSRVFINNVQPIFVYVHEIGHVLGFKHGNSIRNIACLLQGCSKDQILPYYDSYSAMGNEGSTNIINHDKAIAGWIPFNTITRSGQYTIDNKSALNFSKKDSGDKYFIDRTDATVGLTIRIEKGSSSGVVESKEILYVDSTGSKSSYSDFGNNINIIDLGSHQSADGTFFSSAFIRFGVAPRVKTTVVSSTSIKLDWTYPDSVQPIGGYEIYRDSLDVPPIATVSATTNTYTDTGLSSSVKHTYYIKPYDLFIGLGPTRYYMPVGSADSVGAVVGVMHHHSGGTDASGCGDPIPFTNVSSFTAFDGTPNTYCGLSNVEILILPTGYSVKVEPDGPIFTSPGKYDLGTYNDLGTGVTVFKK